MTEYPNWFKMTAEDNFRTYLSEYKDKPNLHFLQLGVFTGDATLWLCENILTGDGSMVVDVDTWQGSDEQSHKEMDFNDVYETYKRKVGLYIQRIHSVKQSSLSFLITELNRHTGIRYDFIYIDADHTASSVLVDAELSWHLLKNGGVMAFDDYTWGRDLAPSKTPRPGILLFVDKHKEELETLVINNQYWIKKK